MESDLEHESNVTLSPSQFQIVIPMSGMGDRFLKKGYSSPKFFIEVEGKKVIEHVLDMYPGFENILFIVNRTHASSPNLNLIPYLKGLRENANVAVVDNHKFGPSWAILQTKHLLDPEKIIVVNYCDFTCLWDLNDLFELMNPKNQIAGLVACYTGFQPHFLRSTHYAFVKTNDSETNNFIKVTDIREKEPYTQDPISEFASSGTYVFKDSTILIEAIKNQVKNNISKFGEYFTSLTVIPLLREKHPVGILPVNKFMQWGTPEDFSDYLYFSNKLKQIYGHQTNNLDTDSNSSIQISTIILAAGIGERFKVAGYKISKPELCLEHTPVIRLIAEMQIGPIKILTNSHTLSNETTAQLYEMGCKVTLLEKNPASQAHSSLVALDDLSIADQVPLNIISCDSLIRFKATQIQELLKRHECIVWVSDPSPVNLLHPNESTWVDHNENGNSARSFAYKSSPEGFANPKVLTGAFTFSNKLHASEIIKQIFHLKTIRGEHFLDQILELEGLKTAVVQISDFISLGTPNEYESTKYWIETFRSWKHHELYKDRWKK